MKKETPEEERKNLRKCYDWIEKANIEEVEEIFAKQTKNQLVKTLAGMAKQMSEWKFDDDGHYIFSKSSRKPVVGSVEVKVHAKDGLICSSCGSEVALPSWAEHFKKGFEELSREG